MAKDSAPLVNLEGVNKSFGNSQVLFDLSFNINRGRIVGLIGPNGAGKTTIMKSIAGLTDYQGSIKISGKKVSKNNTLPLKKVGSLIETPGIYPFMSGFNNLKLYADKTRMEYADLGRILDRTGITQFAHKKAKKYSLGMKQRLGVAIALLNNPELVILDEPMNGLDPESVHAMRSLLTSLADHGISVLISSHILSELELIADDLVVVNHGHILFNGTKDQFFEQQRAGSDKRQVAVKTSDDKKAADILALIGFKPTIQQSVEVFIDNKENTLNKMLQQLVMNKIEILSIKEEQQSLEDSFIEMIKGGEA
ncbi:ABC transporter ATP-binding protein [Oenococcus alcoholitolerans]|uniref:Multidrug ABC transporter ATPase n=1 Tax=Oenococcus alcoholitolerans TaxID=931074 RepID=A0ABR4XSW4_9LACO|nr:multidrug ABC transporter ATPase [Oenococcus alcoholitolerans]